MLRIRKQPGAIAFAFAPNPSLPCQTAPRVNSKFGRGIVRLKANLLRLLGVVLLASPLAAHAVNTTWEIQGHITASRGSDLSAFQPGDLFRILVNFDTAATLINTLTVTPGYRYRYDPSSLSFDIFVGSLGPFHVARGSGPDDSGNIIVRDDATFSDPIITAVPVDGYTFGLTNFDPSDGGVSTTIQLVMRGPVLDIVNGSALAESPDPRLATLVEAVFQVCRLSTGPDCDRGQLDGQIDSVSAPTYGTGYLFTARDCRVTMIDSINDLTPTDCININRPKYQQWTYPARQALGGGLGLGSFSQTLAPTDADIDAMWGTNLHGGLGLPPASLGSLYGSATFGGPAALPIVKGSTSPSDISRLNSNLVAYQKYTYGGAGSQLPLIIGLTYDIGDFNVDPSIPEIGVRPGGAEISAVLSVIDGSVVSMNKVRDAGGNGFGGLECGAESNLGWPVGAILGTAAYLNPEHQSGPQSVQVALQSCATPGQPVQLTAGQDFIVATSMQTPARGKVPQSPSTVGALTNGYVNAANTLRITFDPAAPPAVIQALADSITPACADCNFTPDVLTIAIDVKPGSTDCINAASNGVIPVALLGSEHFDVKDVRLDGSLQLGALHARVRNGRAQCATSQVNGDAYNDLVCNFENASGNWQVGQTSVTLSGKLINGVPITGSDSICVKM